MKNLAFPETIQKPILHLNLILGKHFQGSSKRFAINYLNKMQKKNILKT